MNDTTQKVQDSARGERIHQERARLGLTQPELAAMGGVSKGSQILYEKGNAPTADYLAGIAQAGADILFILTGERGPVSTSLDPAGRMLWRLQRESNLSFAEMRARYQQSGDEEEVSDGDFVAIPVYEANLAAGDGAENEVETIVDHMAFRRDWLRGLGVQPSAALIASARGDSMTPTIQEGDALLIDRARAIPPAKVRAPEDTRPASIYALIDDAGRAMVKRLELAVPGTLILLSDNPDVPPKIRPAASVSILGRVVWWGHTNKD